MFRQTEVALKVFFDPSKNSEAQEEAMNEIKMLNYLRHPGIISLMGFHISKTIEDSFIVLEYVSNGNLFDHVHLKKSALNKKSIMLQIAKVLNFIHLSGLAHRDIKP